MQFEQSMIESLAILEPAVKSAKKGAAAASASAKMLADGEIKNLGKKLADAENELSSALEQIREFREEWEKLGVADYFGSEEYVSELLDALSDAGVDVHPHGDVLYAYPALVRLDVNALSSRIDKKAEPRVRPQRLAAILRDIQNRPTRFPTGRFLGSLFKIYKALGSRNLKSGEDWSGRSMFLKDIYEVIAAAPGSDYSEQEFVRDIYLLDASGEELESRGYLALLQASSTTRDEKKTLSIITRDGQKKLYSTIRFDQIAR